MQQRFWCKGAKAGVGVGRQGWGQKDNGTCLLLEDGIKAGNLVALGVNKGALWLTGDDISGLLGQWQQLANLFQTV